MNNVEMNEKDYRTHPCYAHRTCWSAVISGTIVGVGLLFLFCLLSNGIGLTSATRTEGGTEILIAAAMFWLFVGSYVVFFISGVVTGKIARTHCRHSRHGLVYGFMSWALAIIISIILITPIIESESILMVKASPTEVIETPDMSHNSGHEIMSPATQKEIHRQGLASIAIFLIFAAGALGSSLGSYYAIQYHKEEDEPVTRM